MRINFLSYTFDNRDGYGRHAKFMLRSLHRLGVSAQPIHLDQLSWDGWVQRLAGLDFSYLTFAIMSAGEFIGIPGRQWGLSMYECAKPPEGWAEKINEHLERFIVPSEWLVDVFRKAGVRKTLPIHVVGEGIDPLEVPFLDRRHRSKDRPFTFLSLGDRGGRKGHDLAWSAFHKAFNIDNDDARLVIKCRANNLPNLDLTLNPSWKWLSLWREDVPTMADVYEQVDAFVYPTRGEGWGLPAREAAATGLPVLATNWSGTAVDIEKWGIPLDQYKLVPSSLETRGLWAEPSIDELAEKMRWIYDHQDEAYAIGRRASEWLHANQTWDHATKDLIALLEKWG